MLIAQRFGLAACPHLIREAFLEWHNFENTELILRPFSFTTCGYQIKGDVHMFASISKLTSLHNRRATFVGAMLLTLCLVALSPSMAFAQGRRHRPTPTPTPTATPTPTPRATPTPTPVTGACSGISTISAGGKTYTPTWCQEFNGGAGSPDTTVWKFDLGNNNGWGNGEVEVYCGPPGYPGNPSQCPTLFSTATSPGFIDGSGHLVIQPRNVGGTWISSRMNTENIKNFQYGIIEASIKLPNTTNQGLWPAFWSLGSDIATGTPWPNCGEADIMENWSPQVFSGAGTTGNNSTIHTAVTGGNGIGGRFTFPSGEATDTAFHTYGVIWQPNEMQFFVDNPSTPFFTVTPSNLPAGDTWPFDAPIFILMNVAVGGTLGGSTSGLSNPAPMLVDYVRYYQ